MQLSISSFFMHALYESDVKAIISNNAAILHLLKYHKSSNISYVAAFNIVCFYFSLVLFIFFFFGKL